VEEAAGGLVGEVREEGELRQRSRFNLTIFQEEEEQLSPSSTHSSHRSHRERDKVSTTVVFLKL
jgi:hypothetical protein